MEQGPQPLFFIDIIKMRYYCAGAYVSVVKRRGMLGKFPDGLQTMGIR